MNLQVAPGSLVHPAPSGGELGFTGQGTSGGKGSNKWILLFSHSTPLLLELFSVSDV